MQCQRLPNSLALNAFNRSMRTVQVSCIITVFGNYKAQKESSKYDVHGAGYDHWIEAMLLLPTHLEAWLSVLKQRGRK